MHPGVVGVAAATFAITPSLAQSAAQIAAGKGMLLEACDVAECVAPAAIVSVVASQRAL
jgi:hypothetical protein